MEDQANEYINSGNIELVTYADQQACIDAVMSGAVDAILCNGYYALESVDDKLKYLQKLPHIGKITANHLARNLGEDVVKYDIWIQRLGCVYAGKNLSIDNANLSPEIKDACDAMFMHLCNETKLPRGYIDVVLWKSCQVKLISMDDYLHKPPVM